MTAVDLLLSMVVAQRDLSEVEARSLVDGIRRDGMDVVERTAIAYKGRAWIALGYSSWDAMREVEFSDARLGIPREERAEQVLSLRAAGMSTREIGKSLGVDKDTVSRDLARVPIGDTSPATITDSLGRQQPASKPRPQPSPPSAPPALIAPAAAAGDSPRPDGGEVEQWEQKQQEPSNADLDQQLEDELSSTDERFRSNLVRACAPSYSVLDLTAARAIETYQPGSNAADALELWLIRTTTWIAELRAGLPDLPVYTPTRSLRSVR